MIFHNTPYTNTCWLRQTPARTGRWFPLAKRICNDITVRCDVRAGVSMSMPLAVVGGAGHAEHIDS